MADSNLTASTFIMNLHQRHMFLKGIRNEYEGDWEVILPEFRPELGDLLHTGVDAVTHNSSLYDGYGAQSLAYWAKGIIGNMFYPKPRWMSVALDDRKLMENDQIKDYTQEWGEQLFYGFNRTNFYEVMPEVAMDAGSTIGHLSHTEDTKRGRLHFQHDHIGDVWISVDALGYVDGYDREVHYSAQAAADLWDKSVLPKCVTDQLKDGQDSYKKFTFVHCIFPNPDYDPERQEPYATDLLPYLSVYYESSSLTMVEKSGVRHLPMSWRVHKYARQWYPYSPAQCALVDALMNNQMTKSLQRAAQLTAQPPLLVPQALQGKVYNVPNGFTYYTDELLLDGVRELYSRGVNWVVPNEERERVQGMIDRWFSKEFFTMMTQIMDKTGQPPTAFQIQRAESEKTTLLGPQVGSLKNDIGNPAVDIVWDYETRHSTVPEMPAILEDYLFEKMERTGVARIETINEYTGILAQTQSRVMEQQGVVDALTISAMVVEQYPEAKYALKPYHLMRKGLDTTNLDQDIIAKEDEYQAIIKQIQEDERVAQQSELNKQAAQSYQAMTNAPEPGSPVEGRT